jgi:hypothetical protein
VFNSTYIFFLQMVDSGPYRVALTGDTFTAQDFDACDYGRLNASRVHFVKYLSGKVFIDPTLRKHPLFVDHVDPVEGSPRGILVRVRSKDQDKPQHQRMILLWDGSIACDCKHQYQQGHYCRHDWALWAEGHVDFTANLGIDAYYGRKGSPDGPAVLYELEGDALQYRVTKPWNFASQNATSSVDDLAHATFSVADEQMAEAGHKQVSETAVRRDRLFAMQSSANSAPPAIQKRFDALLRPLEELLEENTKLSKVNKGKHTNFNPQPIKRSVVEITKNKSSKS